MSFCSLLLSVPSGTKTCHFTFLTICQSALPAPADVALTQTVFSQVFLAVPPPTFFHHPIRPLHNCFCLLSSVGLICPVSWLKSVWFPVVSKIQSALVSTACRTLPKLALPPYPAGAPSLSASPPAHISWPHCSFCTPLSIRLLGFAGNVVPVGKAF